MFISFSCMEKQIQMPFSNEHFESVADYLNSTSKIENAENNPADTIKTLFCFANNPYKFDERAKLFIYANNKKVFDGDYSTAVKLSLSQFEGNSIPIHFTVHILYPKKNKYILYRFRNKSVIGWWEREYKFLYACFFPTNQNIDRIHFFPAKYDVIQ